MKEKNPIRWIAFLPAVILLSAAVIIDLINEELMINVFTTLNNLFMTKMGWIASLLAVIGLILLVVVLFTPFGNVRLGGKDAKPTLSTFSWFCIALTTTLASGILIWSYDEPIYHLADPASALTGIEPMTGEAAKFAMETMYMHWSVIPYAIYTVPAVVFGYMIYNCKKSYSVSSQISPLISKADTGVGREIVDGLLLLCIGISMAGSCGLSLTNMVGCWDAMFNTGYSNGWLLLFTIVIGGIAIITAITGVQKGVKLAARLNVYGYIILFAFILFLGPTSYIFGLGTEATGGFLTHFFERALYTGTSVDSNWPQSWTTFYWASWMAWGPTSGIFLASIAYGRKIKEMVLMNVGVCSIAAMIMVAIMSGASIYGQLNGIDIMGAMNEFGIGAGPYVLLKSMPGGMIMVVISAILIVMTLVTAMNGNMIAMSGLSHKVAQAEDGKDLTPWYTKLIWGGLICAITYISFAALGGYTGVKTMCNIGGIVATVLMIGIVGSLFVLLFKYKKFDIVDNESEDLEKEN